MKPNALPWIGVLWSAAISGAVPGPSPAPAAEIREVRRIWDAGRHNAFTDLVHWHGRWWCTFREAEAHVGGDGAIRVIESADGTAWTSAACLTEPDIDLRDPKFSVTPDNRLMIVCGGPNFIRAPDHSWIVATRDYVTPPPGAAKGFTTMIGRMGEDRSIDRLITLPSGGDTSYAGIVWHSNGLLWLSYYSSHEGKSAIYLAKLAVQ